MPDIKLTVNGTPISVPAGTTVAAAVMRSGISGFRKSVTGQLRRPLCGMGICFECRVTVNGTPYARSCQIPCAGGMDVRTDE